MVKATYAVTLFAAASMAAPMAPNSNDYTGVEPMRRDGTGNFIGAGADGSLNQLTPKQKAEVAEAAKHQKPSIFQGLPLIGGLFGGGKRSVEEQDLHARSLTGDLSHLPLLGELFGGNQGHNQNSNKPLGNGDAMPAMTARSYEYPGQNHGQNYGQNAGQNAGQNEGQNAGQNEGQNEGQNWMQNYGQNDGQNDDQNDDQNDGQNWLQNYAQNHRRDLTSELSSLPIIGGLLGGAKKTDAAKRDNEAKPETLGLLSFVQKLTSGGAETISHRRRDFFDVLKTPQQLAQEQQAEKAKGGDKGKDTQKPAQDAKQAIETPFKELISESGLAGLVGNANHGVGLLPMNGRRDVEVEPRGEPIQGATLSDVLLNGGVLGKVANLLSPGGLAPAGQ